MDNVISFPHLGPYYVVFEYFLSNACKCNVIVPPPSTRRTIELGSKHSPDFVCVPFKYNLGNYIEALETHPEYRKKGYGAKLLLQVLDLLKETGGFKICDCIRKENIASLDNHKKCGFEIVSEKGYDYLQKESDERSYVME